jgi:EmrB/QacA subfamily drug resistance transporter
MRSPTKWADKPSFVLLVGSMGCAMTVLDANITAVVLPTIARDLGASFADVEWVISAYILCFASLLLPAGSIADRFGRRKVFLIGITLFGLASLLCGAAPSVSILSLSRAAQGFGAAFLLAPALATIGHAFDDETARAKAWAVWGGIMGLTMVLAPILGGVIAFALGWRWAFYINVPICILLEIAVARTPESRDTNANKLDPWGILLFAGTMLGLTWGLIQGQARGWLSTQSLEGFIGGVSAFILFLFAETRRARPMLDLALFRLRRFVGAVLAMFAYAASAQVMAQLLPLYLQNGLGQPPLATGFAMLPFALAMLIFPQIGRRLSHSLASWQILVLGLSVVCVGNLVLAWATAEFYRPLVIFGMLILGSGGGLLNGETQKAIMSAVPRDRAGMASGISTTARFSGILLGFAVLNAILAMRGRAVLTSQVCLVLKNHCSDAHGLADMVIAGVIPRAIIQFDPKHQALAADIAHHGYALGFTSSLLAAAAIGGLSAAFVAVLMRSNIDITSTRVESTADSACAVDGVDEFDLISGGAERCPDSA